MFQSGNMFYRNQNTLNQKLNSINYQDNIRVKTL